MFVGGLLFHLLCPPPIPRVHTACPTRGPVHDVRRVLVCREIVLLVVCAGGVPALKLIEVLHRCTGSSPLVAVLALTTKPPQGTGGLFAM